MKIAHLSDIQIRALKRHKEFSRHFDNLYASLKDEKPDVIVLTGDIVHQKSFVSPELIRMCSIFFTELAKIATTVIIPGNHDLVMNNLSRLDTLTPIIEALDNPNIHYFKDSGVYSLNQIARTKLPLFMDIRFFVFSCFNESSWPTKKDAQKFNGDDDDEIIDIGLYHGFVNGAILQNGMQIYEDTHKVHEFLEIVDYLMLGDIHKIQILDHQYRAAYAGSLIQQNYGESTTKGYLMWDIESKDKHTVDFIELPNVCPFYTVELKDDLKIPELELQKKARIRINSRQLSMIERDNLRTKLTDLHSPVEIKFIDDASGHRQEVKLRSIDTTIEKLEDVVVQEKLIKAWLKSYKLDESLMSQILNINQKYDALLKKQGDVVRNVQYKIRKVWWDNICSFGPGNEFDFQKYPGILGVFGKNGVGKSTFAVDVLSYVLQNKVSKKVTKNDLLINENKDSCLAGMEISSGDKEYKIERNTKVYVKSGKKKGKPITQGKTDVDFRVYFDDTEEVRNGEERSVTDNEIRKVFGSYDDFIATSIAPQWQLMDFIDKGGTERQKLIGKYLDIDIFAQKHKLAREEIKEVKGKLKLLSEKNFDKEIKDRKTILNAVRKKLRGAKKSQKENEVVVKELNEEIEVLRNQMVHNIDLGRVTEESLNSDIATVKIELLNQENKVENIESDIVKFKSEIKKLKSAMSQLNVVELRSDEEQYNSWSNEKGFLEEAINQIQDDIVDTNKRVSKLQDYVCISNENCCMQKDLIDAQKDRDIKYNNLSFSEAEHASLSSLIDKFNIGETRKQLGLYTKNEKELLVEESSLGFIQVSFGAEKDILNLLKEKVDRTNKLKETYLKNKENLEKNEKLSNEINQVRLKRDQLRTHAKELLEDVITLSTEEGSAKTLLEELKKSKNQLDDLRKEYEAYDYFSQAMGKDGIPQVIIRDNLSIINKQIERILSDTGFTATLEPDLDGKSTEIYFRQEKSRKRHISLVGGMEKTFCALALRAALVNITTSPKFNIFVLDECFGALDSEWIEVATRVLFNLKEYFDTIVIITHNDHLKDVVDHVVCVERDEQGYSQIE